MDKQAVKKVSLSERNSDFAYWQSQTIQSRLEALEEIRNEFNSWKYADEQRFQRVYHIVKFK